MPYSAHIRPRFSLYCLEEGEEYLDEAICTYFPPSEKARGLPLGKRPQLSGRLRLCSNSLFFEPDEMREPLSKFSLCNMEEEEVTGTHQSSWDFPNVFLFHCEVVTQMLQHGAVRPHSTVHIPGQHIFSLTFMAVHEFLKKLNHLLQVQQLPPSGREQTLQLLIQQRDGDYKFDFGWLDDPKEQILYEHSAYSVLPLVRIRGRVVVTDQGVYFQAFSDVSATPVVHIRREHVSQVERRRYMLRNTGIEVRSSKVVLFIGFQATEEWECTRLYNLLADHPAPLTKHHNELEMVTKRWQHREVSNYDYLTYLNFAAGRSTNDLSQYPVFPWVLADYESSTIDLADPSVYRDLSKPIGALNPTRLEYFKERMLQMEAAMDEPTPEAVSPPKSNSPQRLSSFLSFLTKPKSSSSQSLCPAPELPKPRQPYKQTSFLYGTHYSTPGYVVFFLLRQRPDFMLLLQKGKYDAPDRLFDSVPGCWRSVTTLHTDLKELIPEFYGSDTSFLCNQFGYDLGLGVKQDGRLVRETVELPPWANDDPVEFLRIQREALEGDYVSTHLHQWIDLVFGCNQRGTAAIEHDNVFHPLTYEDSIQWEEIEDTTERDALERQVQEFGQTPQQLFTKPHPKRMPVTSIGEHLKVVVNGSLRFQDDEKDPMDISPGEVSPLSHESSESCGLTSPSTVTTITVPHVQSIFSPTQRAMEEGITHYMAEEPRECADVMQDTHQGLDFQAADPRSPSYTTLQPVASDEPADLTATPEGQPKAIPPHCSLKAHTAAIICCSCRPKGMTEWLLSQQPCLGRYPLIASTVSVHGELKIHNLRVPETGCSFRVAGFPVALATICLMHTCRTPLMLAGTEDGTIALCSAETSAILDSVNGHWSAVTCLALSSDDRLLVSGSRDAAVKLWRVRDGGIYDQPILEFHHEGEVTAVDVSSDDRCALSASLDGTVCIFNLQRGGTCESSIHAYLDGASGGYWLDPSKFMVTGCKGGFKVFLLGEEMHDLEVTTPPILAGHILSTGRRRAFFAASETGCIDIYDLRSGNHLASLRRPSGFSPPYAICAFPDGRNVAVGDANGTLTLWKWA